MKGTHDSVPVHLGHNGGRGNAVAAAVPLFQAPIGIGTGTGWIPSTRQKSGRGSREIIACFIACKEA